MVKKIFIAVNYGSAGLIIPWSDSIKCCTDDAIIILVDNYKSDDERNRVCELCSERDIELIESDNVGYGSALNTAIAYAVSKYTDSKIIFFAGNLDIEYTAIQVLPYGNFVYVPVALEGQRNRNPFLTKVQRGLLPLHSLTLNTMSPIVLMAVTTILKLASWIPSKTWAVHGSLFCFSSEIIRNGAIFNEKSFLYSEELEFASYADSVNAKRMPVSVVYKHSAHVSTSTVIKNRKTFLEFWQGSFRNWRARWF